MRTMPSAPSAVLAVPVTVEPEKPIMEDSPELVEEDLLVEDVSIDGMCGVY